MNEVSRLPLNLAHTEILKRGVGRVESETYTIQAPWGAQEHASPKESAPH